MTTSVAAPATTDRQASELEAIATAVRAAIPNLV